MNNKKKKNLFSDDNLIFIMVVMFFMALFGYKLNSIFGSKKMKLPGIRTSGTEVIDTAMITSLDKLITERAQSKKKRKKWLKLAHHSSIVTVTRYNPVQSQCDVDPLHTADNSEINLKKLKNDKIKWVAVSQDLLSKYNYGDKIELISEDDPSINGVYTVHDCMNRRFTNRVDILTHPKKDMGKGLWKEVLVAKI